MKNAFLGDNHNDMCHNRVHYKNCKVAHQSD
ncbi:Orphan protein [Fusobacterium necrophorum subsp. funduliforme]